MGFAGFSSLRWFLKERLDIGMRVAPSSPRIAGREEGAPWFKVAITARGRRDRPAPRDADEDESSLVGASVVRRRRRARCHC